MRGPMVGITDEELFDIAEAVHQTSGGTELYRLFDVRTQEDLVSHLVARSEISLREIFGAVRFSTFSTQSKRTRP